MEIYLGVVGGSTLYQDACESGAFANFQSMGKSKGNYCCTYNWETRQCWLSQ